jgi:hypothetical protein
MNLHTLQFFNPYRDIRHTKNRLPHWQQSGAVYFVTFRLADAISKHLREELEQQRRIWLRYHPEPWTAEVEREYHQRFTGAIERWLDVGYGSCLLRRPACARIVAETLQHFDGQRYSQIAWVVMPNHVHALFSLYEDCLLEKVLHTGRVSLPIGSTGWSQGAATACRPGATGSRPSFARLFRPPGKG